MRDERILVATNGSVLTMGKDHFEIAHQMNEEPRTMIDGRLMNEITKDILKDRRKLGESGGVFVLMTREPDTGNVVAGPEIILRGIATPDLEAIVIEKARTLVVRLVREAKSELDHGKYSGDLAETIRVEVRRLVHSIIGKKPVVIPFILDL